MTPVGLLDLVDPTTFVEHDPHEFWRVVRERDPVYWHEPCGFWVVSRYRDVVSCYGDIAALSSSRGTVLDVLLSGDDSAGGKMLAVSDRPWHRELRNVMWRAFSPRVLDEVSGKVHRRANRPVRELTERDSFDFATEFA